MPDSRLPYSGYLHILVMYRDILVMYSGYVHGLVMYRVMCKVNSAGTL